MWIKRAMRDIARSMMGRRIALAAVAVAAFMIGIVADRVYRHSRHTAGDATDHLVYQLRVSQFRVLRRPARVLMVGDSLTAFGEWSELLGPGAVNRGIGGDTTGGLIARLDALPSAQRTYLMIGTNDLARLTPEEIAARTQVIVGRLPGQVFVQSVLYRHDGYRAQITRLNALNRHWCETSGRCRYIGLNAAVTSRARDGLHLDGAAYQAWADQIH